MSASLVVAVVGDCVSLLDSLHEQDIAELPEASTFKSEAVGVTAAAAFLDKNGFSTPTHLSRAHEDDIKISRCIVNRNQWTEVSSRQ